MNRWRGSRGHEAASALAQAPPAPLAQPALWCYAEALRRAEPQRSLDFPSRLSPTSVALGASLCRDLTPPGLP